MYRAVALHVIDSGVELSDGAVASAIRDASFDVAYSGTDLTISVNGREVSDRIRARNVTNMSSIISAFPSVRDRLVEEQRRIAVRETSRRVGVIVEGRDIGTVVFPEAEVKIYLDADAVERARRRIAEMGDQETPIDPDQIAADIRDRDERDRNRKLSPLRIASDAIVIDTTSLTFEEQLKRIESVIRERDTKNMVRE